MFRLMLPTGGGSRRSTNHCDVTRTSNRTPAKTRSSSAAEARGDPVHAPGMPVRQLADPATCHRCSAADGNLDGDSERCI